MIGYLLAALRDRIARQTALTLLTLAAVALGVASVVAIQLVNQSAVAAFSAGMRAVDGDVDLSIVPDGPALAEQAWRIAISDPDVVLALPIVDVVARVRGATGELSPFLDLVGTDVALASDLPYSDSAMKLGEPLTEPGWVALCAPLAARLGLEVGDEFAVSLGTREATLRLGALLDLERRSLLAGDRLAVMDVARAQEAFGRIGELDRVDLRLRDGARPDEVISRLAVRLPSGSRVLTPRQREAQTEGLLEAFEVNLTALSFVSVLVGLLLVFSAVRAQLVRRRGEFGTLRALGATRAQALMLALVEVAIVAAAGCALGAPLGIVAAQDSVATVSSTLTNLYLLDAIHDLATPSWLVPLALAVGIGGALLAAAPPVLEIARADPRQLLSPRAVERRLDRAAPALAVLGIALVAIAFVVHGLAFPDSRYGGFVLGAVVLVGLPLVVPQAFVRGLSGLGRNGFGLGHAARSLSRRVSTPAIAAAALSVAVSMLFAITLMVGSFRDTVGRWIDTAIRADVYVATLTFGRALSDAGIDDAIVAAIESDPAVAAVDVQRKSQAWVDVDGTGGSAAPRRVTVLGVDARLPGGEVRFPLVSGSSADVGAKLAAGGTALVSEPFAVKTGIGEGDVLPLPGGPGAGPWRLQVAGVYRDYTSEHGVVVVDVAEYARGLGEGQANSLGVYLRPGADSAAAIDRWRERFPDAPLTLTPNFRLRAEAMRIFDQTFVVTRLLEATALAVAALGVALGLLILAAERRSEIALVRALGATRRQVFLLFLGKGVTIGMAGLVAGAVGGALLAHVLVHVINRAWFGWTIELNFPAGAMARQTAAILLAVALASLYPSVLASRESGVELGRDRE